MSKCEINIQKNGANFEIRVKGIIDEDMDFAPFSLADAKQLDFYLADIKSINSCGIREWIKWLNTASNQSLTHYHECPKIIVDQINMVQGFLPAAAKVKSFFVPYYNDDSGTEKNILFRFGHEFTDSGVTAPAEVKDESGAVMEMDVVESKYFKFLKSKT